jgi:hypothetical protein
MAKEDQHKNEGKFELDSLNQFDSLLLQTIDEIIQYCLGETNTQLIYKHLERKHCPRQEIPKNLEIFTMEFENLIGSGRGQILGAAKILLNEIVKTLCMKLEISFNKNSTGYFPEQIRNLKEIYIQQKAIHREQKSEARA